MPSEKRAYKALKRLHPKAHFQRIETWTGEGIFDLNGCCDGQEVWVECKQTDRPKKKETPIKAKVRKGQIPWEYERRKAGGKTFVALMVDQELYLLSGDKIKDLVAGIEQKILESIRLSPLNLFKH